MYMDKNTREDYLKALASHYIVHNKIGYFDLFKKPKSFLKQLCKDLAIPVNKVEIVPKRQIGQWVQIDDDFIGQVSKIGKKYYGLDEFFMKLKDFTNSNGKLTHIYHAEATDRKRNIYIPTIDMLDTLEPFETFPDIKFLIETKHNYPNQTLP